MEIQVYSVNIEDRLPRGIPEGCTVSDLRYDGVSMIKGQVVEKVAEGCCAFVWGRTAEGESVCVRVDGIRPRLFFELEADETTMDVKHELEAEVSTYIHRDDCGIEVTEGQYCHFYGYEPDATSPSGRVVHRYAEAFYPNLSSWRRATALRKNKEVRELRVTIEQCRATIAAADSHRTELHRLAQRDSSHVDEYREVEERLTKLRAQEEMFSNRLAAFTNDDDDSVEDMEPERPLRPAHEWFVDPTTRFLQEARLLPSRWYRVPAVDVGVHVTTCTYELRGSMDCFEEVDRNDDAPYKRLYYDIETLGLLPETSSVVQVSIVVRQGSTKTKYLVCTGTHDRIDGVVIRECSGEKELLLEVRRIVMEEDPEFVIAYNGVNFDNPFLDGRARMLNVVDFFYLSRFALRPCRLRNLPLSSSGMRDNNLRFFDMPGRSNFDWYVKLGRDLTQEDSYSLDYMAKKFCGTQKVELASGLKWKSISDALVTDPEYELTNAPSLAAALGSGRALQTFSQDEWRALEVNVDLCEHHWITVGSQRYKPVNTKHRAIPDLYYGTSKDRARLGYYCVEDSDLLDQLDTARNMTIEILQFAGVFGITVEWVYFRGQQVRFVSQLLRKVRGGVEAMPLLLQRPPEGFSGQDVVGFKGATVNSPKAGFYNRPVVVTDWASLYPAIMMSHNLCHSTLARDPKLHDMQGVVRHEVNSEFTTHFVKEEVHKGILPILLEELKAERTRAKSMVKKHFKLAKDADTDEERTKHQILSKVWDSRQLAIKVSMNSIYGACGTSIEAGAKYPCLAISATVTYQGRMAMVIKKELLPKHFPGIDIIYGDTDSVMLVFKDVTDVDEAGRLGTQAADVITDYFVNTLRLKKMDMEFEKVYYPYLLQGKKRYVGIVYKPTGDGTLVCDGFDAKGVETERRDTLPFLKEIYYDVREALMVQRDPDEALRRFRVRMDTLVRNEVPIEMLTLKKFLSSKVENKTATIAHARVNAKRREREAGSEANVNEQVEYVILAGHKDAKTTMLAEDPVFVREEGLKLNLLWYFEHCIKSAMEKVFGVFDTIDYASICREYKERLNAERLGVNSGALRMIMGGGGSTSAAPTPREPRPPLPKRKKR